MKKYVLIAALMLSAAGVKAQDCEALILPYFGNNRAVMDRYPADKQDYYCMMARAAFYVSDTVPAGAEVVNFSEVQPYRGSAPLPANYVVDLNTLSYFAYNFEMFQKRNGFETTVCFSTPSSTHPYLVMRSYSDMMEIVNNEFRNKYERR